MNHRLQVVDLFCGCGGLSLGAAKAGLNPIIAVDSDPDLTSSFERNHIGTKLLRGDVSDLTSQGLTRMIGGPVDGVIGGPPCQGFSDIGKRDVDDPRRLLLLEFFRIVAELNPAFFVMENVKGLGYSDARPILDNGLSLLPAMYKIVGPLILDAADYGAATRRARIFVIGYDPNRMGTLAEEDIVSATTQPASVKAAISDLSVAEPLGESEGFDLWRIRAKGRPAAYASRLRSPDGVFTGHRRTAHTSAVVERFAALQQGAIDRVGRHQRLRWDGQCPTLRAGTGSDRGSFQSVRPIHPEEPRVITVREAARLQGFPDWFRFHPTVWHSFRMIGNSVSPIISEAIFRLIAERLEVRHAASIAAE